MQAGLAGQPARSSFIGDLRTVLAGSGFRKLYATRLVSQTGDGIFTAGLGTYVFFNATTFPNPVSATVAFAVLYLPYSLIGPFAGVFIDRWSRRQILLWSAIVRACFAGLTAAFIAAGALGLPVWLAALVVLGVNRFFLSALSAALPHVVEPDEYVMANSVGPTSGTIVSFVGGLLGLVVRLLTGPGAVDSAITLLAAGMCYLLAGLSATRMRKDALGPDLGAKAHPGSVTQELGSVAADLESVAAGLIAGLRHVWARRRARAALLATGAHRFLYGILLLMSILLYRNFYYPGSDANTALKHFLPVVVSSAIGYGLAAVITPIATRRVSNAVWITALLAAGGLLTAALGVGFGQVEFVLIGFILGIVAQGIAISTTTILQREMTDEYRGRVFSVNDMVYNALFVLGAAISAAFMPLNGHSIPAILVVGCGYVAASVAYRVMAGQSPPGGPSPAGDSAAEPAAASPAEPASGSAEPASGSAAEGKPAERAQPSSS